jgi:SAM-dependent methyltransferase
MNNLKPIDSPSGTQKNINETPEFFVPGNGLRIEDYIDLNDISGVHHLARYAWASTILPQQGRLLDIACGAGYGTHMLALENPNLQVTGVDYDPRAIEHAKSNYSASNLTFNVGNLIEWNYLDGRVLGEFDVIISFDTIEHLLHREIALINLAENLSSEGILLFSTPSGHASPLLNPAWEHHKIEYSANLLLNLMSRFFGTVRYPDNGTLPNQEYWIGLNSGRNIYLNMMNPIVCSDPIKKRTSHAQP